MRFKIGEQVYFRDQEIIKTGTITGSVGRGQWSVSTASGKKYVDESILNHGTPWKVEEKTAVRRSRKNNEDRIESLIDRRERILKQLADLQVQMYADSNVQRLIERGGDPVKDEYWKVRYEPLFTKLDKIEDELESLA